MSKKRFLDLDALVGEPGVLKFRGKEYTIPEMDLEKFMKLLQVQEAVEENDTTGNINAARQMLKEAIEGFTDKDVNALTVRQMTALIQFIVNEVQGVGGEDGGNPPSLEAVK